MTRDELVQLVEAAARSEGVSPEALLAIANLESSGNVRAENPNSSASGLFQFVDKTAAEYGLTGSKRNDPEAQAYAAAKMMATNQRAMTRSLGREPSPGELYLAHQQGLAGATALLKNPDKPAVEVLAGVYKNRDRAEQAVRLNGGNTSQTAGQFAGQWVSKANQRVAAIPPGSVPNTVGSQVDVQPRAVTGMPTPASQRPAQYEYTRAGRPIDPDNKFLMDESDPRYREAIAGSPVESVRQSASNVQVPLPRPRPDMPVAPYEQGQTVATVETAKPQRLPPIVPNGVTYAGQERGPTTAPRKPAVTPTPEQAEAATGFRLPDVVQREMSKPTVSGAVSFAGQERGPATQPRIALFSELPGPSSPPKTQDRLDTGQAVIVPRSGTVQPTRQQVEQGTGFRLGSPLTEEVEVENPAYTALMKRVQQGEIELKGIAPSGMAMSRDARARYEASMKALEAKRQQLAGMSRTTTVTRQVAQQRAPVQQPKRAPVVQQQRPVINPANHNQAQLDAVAAGRSGYTSSSGAVLPTHSIGGKLRYTYGE